MNEKIIQDTGYSLTPDDKSWGWRLITGIVLTILGVIALSSLVLTTLVSVIFFGSILIINGITLIFYASRFRKNKESYFAMNITLGILYTIAGLIFILYPLPSAAMLTLVLASLLMVIGLLRISTALSNRRHMHHWHHWVWVLTNGILSVLLSIFILLQWPISSLWVIGLFVGIDILFMGILFIISALSIHRPHFHWLHLPRH